MGKKLDEKSCSQHLAEQISFLQSSARLYDNGREIEAKRMALTIRILTHDTKSLLGQMRLKKSMKFISTAYKYEETNLLTQQCLLYMRLNNNGFKYLPMLKESKNCRYLSYKEWINEIVIVDKDRKTYNRLSLIKLLANQDGGAHVDPVISDEFATLKEPDVAGWQFMDSHGNTNYGNDPVYASMRQIAFEILHSIYKVRPKLFYENYF